ncbi:MAG: hypothetical protein ACI89X_004728 [Planctomycetota bacterium]|jgi:hypothetical protein
MPPAWGAVPELESLRLVGLPLQLVPVRLRLPAWEWPALVHTVMHPAKE